MSPVAPEELGTVLAVGAHPDDETYLMAGIMAACARNGQRVMCVTATKGEEGSMDEAKWPPEQMGTVREAELKAGLDVLGVREHAFLGYRDATCSAVDDEEATGRVRAIVQALKPDSVLTFGPDGMTDHPDHKAVSAWTTRAFRDAAPDGARLFYATMTPGWAEEFVPRMNRFNVFAPGRPPVTPVEDLAIHYTLPPEILELKLRAIDCHRSQVEGMMEAFGRDFFREAHCAEFFVIAS